MWWIVMWWIVTSQKWFVYGTRYMIIIMNISEEQSYGWKVVTPSLKVSIYGDMLCRFVPEGNCLYSLCKTWLVFKVMFFANLSLLLSYVEVYSPWSGCPTIFEQIFSCCNICDFRATDRHPYQVVLQYWRTLMITEVKNKRRILLLAPKDLKRRRK